MPRPKRDLVNCSLRLPPELKDWLWEEAEKRVVSPGRLAEFLIEEGRKRLVPLEETYSDKRAEQ